MNDSSDLTLILSRRDATLILYAIRAMSIQLDNNSPYLIEAIKSYERQLPVELSRMTDPGIELFREKREVKR